MSYNRKRTRGIASVGSYLGRKLARTMNERSSEQEEKSAHGHSYIQRHRYRHPRADVKRRVAEIFRTSATNIYTVSGVGAFKAASPNWSHQFLASLWGPGDQQNIIATVPGSTSTSNVYLKKGTILVKFNSVNTLSNFTLDIYTYRCRPGFATIDPTSAIQAGFTLINGGYAALGYLANHALTLFDSPTFVRKYKVKHKKRFRFCEGHHEHAFSWRVGARITNQDHATTAAYGECDNFFMVLRPAQTFTTGTSGNLPGHVSTADCGVSWIAYEKYYYTYTTDLNMTSNLPSALDTITLANQYLPPSSEFEYAGVVSALPTLNTNQV